MTRTSVEEQAPASVRIRTTWWLHPAWAMLLCGSVGPLFAWRASDDAFTGVWLTPRYWGTDDSILAAVYICCFCAAAVLLAHGASAVSGSAAAPRTIRLKPSDVEFLRKAAKTFLVLTVLGYLLWAGKGLLGGLTLSDVVDVVRGERGAVGYVKRVATPVGGVTTLTQFGPMVIIINHLLRRAGVRVDRRFEITVLVLAAARSVLYAERLALIEVLLPYVVVACALAPKAERPVLSRLRATAPLVAPVFLLVFFGVFEHSRSWSNYWEAQYKGGNYSQFVLDRTTGYYATSSNNSALLRQGFDEQMPLPYYTMKIVWNLPLVSEFVDYEAVTGFNPGPQWASHLALNANPEFNNEGGLLTAQVDYGTVGGAVYWLLFGGLAGYIYRHLRAGKPWALLVYGVSFVGLLEVGRISYLGTGRFLPTLIGVLYIAHRLASQSDDPRPAPSRPRRLSA